MAFAWRCCQLLDLCVLVICVLPSVFLLCGCATSHGNVAGYDHVYSTLDKRFGTNSEHTRLRCQTTVGTHRPDLVIGVKTTRFYHSSRVNALWEAWGHRMGYALIFVTDGPLDEAASWPASVVVVDDVVDARRTAAYIPPWREGGEDPDLIDPFALPQLTRRVAALVDAMHSCWGGVAQWFMIVDDDTFVRPDLIRAALSTVDSDKLQLLGIPTSSDKFALPEHQALHGPSFHCGGSSIVMSGSMVDRVVEFAGECIQGPPRTILAWYWDEVELLGRCAYELLRINCSQPPDLEFSALEMPLSLMMMVKDLSDFDAVSQYVSRELGGLWHRLPIATLHPVLAPQMRWLGERFAGDELTYKLSPGRLDNEIGVARARVGAQLEL